MKVMLGWVFATSALLASRPSDACIPLGNTDHDIDAEFAADTVAPGAPSVALGEVARADANSCTGSYVELLVDATDDQAPTNRLGYDVTILDDDSVLLDDARVVRSFGQSLYLHFVPPLRDDLAAFDLRAEVRAVDLNGNIGEPTLFEAHVDVPEPGDGGGCSAGGTSPGWLGLAALALLRRRRR